MVFFDFDRKEDFTVSTQLQDLGRLLSRASRESHDVIREVVQWAANGGSLRFHNGEAGFESGEMRMILWDRVRAVREVLLKCLVFLQLKDSLPAVNEAIQVGAALWNQREAVRRRAQEFYEIQWPPLGAFPPPLPPYAVEAASDVLQASKYLGLPTYTQLAVEQTGCDPIDCVQQLKLSETVRNNIERKLTAAILADYALAASKNSDTQNALDFVEFKLVRGRIHLLSEGEYELVFISDFRKFQFESCKILIGSNIGYASSFQLELGAVNTMQSACNVVVDTFEALRRRAMYQLNSWKALMNGAKEARLKVVRTQAFYEWLESQDMLPEKVNASIMTRNITEGLFDQVLDKKPPAEPPTAAAPNAETPTAGEQFSGVAALVAARQTAEESSVGAAETTNGEPSAAMTDDDEAVGKEEQFRSFKEVTDELYTKLRDLEFKCARRLDVERQRYRTLDDNWFSFEFYRYVIRMASRISRYVAWLMLRDQARCIRECQLPPTGLFHVSTTRKNRLGEGSASSMIDPAEEIPAWRILFNEYFQDPEGDPAIDKSYPEVTREIAFASLFGKATFPSHAEYLDIDILPGLPLSVFDLIAESFGENLKKKNAVCRLTFVMDHYLGELSVELWPLHGIITAWKEGTENITQSLDTDTLVKDLSNLPSLKAFYFKDYVKNSSSVIKGFVPRSLNLTTWLSRAYRVMSSLVLRLINMELKKCFNEQQAWSFEVLESVSEAAQRNFEKDLDVSVLRIKHSGQTMFTIWVDFLTGTLCLNPTAFGSWLARLDINTEQASNYVCHLVNHLLQGDIPKLVEALQSLEPLVQQAPPFDDQQNIEPIHMPPTKIRSVAT